MVKLFLRRYLETDFLIDNFNFKYVPQSTHYLQKIKDNFLWSCLLQYEHTTYIYLPCNSNLHIPSISKKYLPQHLTNQQSFNRCLCFMILDAILGNMQDNLKSNIMHRLSTICKLCNIYILWARNNLGKLDDYPENFVILQKSMDQVHQQIRICLGPFMLRNPMRMIPKCMLHRSVRNQFPDPQFLCAIPAAEVLDRLHYLFYHSRPLEQPPSRQKKTRVFKD